MISLTPVLLSVVLYSLWTFGDHGWCNPAESLAFNNKMTSHEIVVPEPVISNQRNVTKLLMCGPGPCDVWPSVAEALAGPVMSPYCGEHSVVLDEIRAGIQYTFQTRSNLVLAISGSGHSGMETVITNLIAPGEVLLVPSRGFWDERACIIAARYGIRVEVIRTSVPFTTFKMEELEAALKEFRPAGMFITHGDSSTGTVQDLKGLGDLCHKYGTLLLVDTVVSLGAEPFLMDEWGIDAVYASSQKTLSGPAGISPVAFSTRAEDMINNRKHEPPFYFDMKLLAQQWNCYDKIHAYHHTPSQPMLWALRSCLQEIIAETLQKSWSRHTAVTAHFHKRLQELGFQLLIKKPEDRLVNVTTIELPKGYDYIKFVDHMISKHNILIMPGVGLTAGLALRVGIMGVNATFEVADLVADAMADTLRCLTKLS